MEIKKKNFLLDLSLHRSIDCLSDAEAGKLIKALYNFADDGETTSFKNKMTQMIYEFATESIADNTEKWKTQVRKRRIGGYATAKKIYERDHGQGTFPFRTSDEFYQWKECGIMPNEDVEPDERQQETEFKACKLIDENEDFP